MATDPPCKIINDLIDSIDQKDFDNNNTNNKMQKLISTKIIEGYKFGRIALHKNVIICDTSLSYASVNLKPITPGHVMVMPKRIVPRVSGLSIEELGDIWYLAQQMGIVLERAYSAKSITFAIQDGKYAGQTIDHVHIHIIPRYPNDFKENDQVYVELEKQAVVEGNNIKSIGIVDDEQRKVQTMEEMANEALSYREIIDSM